jgi:GntR family transcriptional regulator
MQYTQPELNSLNYTASTNGGCIVVNIVISNSSDEPIYLQIVNQIKEQIIKGELSDSQPLPSIRNLARELNISVITSKRAYDELEKDGFIVSVAGKGSYVAPINNEMLREAKIRMIEEKMTDAVSTAKMLGLTLDELTEMLKLIYEE